MSCMPETLSQQESPCQRRLRMPHLADLHEGGAQLGQDLPQPRSLPVIIPLIDTFLVRCIHDTC